MNTPALKEDALNEQTLTTMLTMAETLAKSGLMPPALNTKEKVFIALQWGRELGLQPMAAVTNIAVINGKPSLSVDIMHAIIRRNPEYAGLEWVKTSGTEAEAVVKRKCGATTESFQGYFNLEMAKRAGLSCGDPKSAWSKYPERMLKKRALSFALRDAFSDVVAGVYDPAAGYSETLSDECGAETLTITSEKDVASSNPDCRSEQETSTAGKTDASKQEPPALSGGFDYAAQFQQLCKRAQEIAQLLTEEQKTIFRGRIEKIMGLISAKARFEKMSAVVLDMQKQANPVDTGQASLEIY